MPRGHLQTLATRKKIGKTMKKVMANPIMRIRHSRIMKEIMSRPETRDRISKTISEFKMQPENRRKNSETVKRFWANQKNRIKRSMSIKIGWAKNREKVLGDKHWNWHGGKTKNPYSLEFTKELREKIRKRDGNKCMECGVPQRECERVLSTHHINYDKQDCREENLITLCVGCNVKANYGRKEWEQYFKRRLTGNM